jgi:putative aldouronate transport system permease protein
MMLPSAVMLLIFHFYPLWGIAFAFVKYSPTKGLAGSPFVGLEHFQRFLGGPNALSILRNTVLIAVGKLAMGELAGLAFALLINEIRHVGFRRVAQTTTTLPHFLSWVLIGGVVAEVLSTTGLANKGIAALGFEPVRFLGNARVFPWTLILTETWKEFGWGAVIYLAALTAINPELYEAAAVDGAGRWARLWHISLPGIMPMIVLLTCLNLGGILNAGFEQVLVFLNPIVMPTGDILDTYIYRVGLLSGEISLGTAVGLFKSVIGFGLVWLSYWMAGKFANYRIF